MAMSFLVPRLRARASAGSAMALRGVRLQSSWKPAVKPGTVPVYDEALAYLEADAQVVRERIEEESQKADSSEESQRRLYGLRVVSEINLPHVRSQYKQGNCVYGMLTTDDLREPVFRHLREQAWRQSGVLNRLEERLQCMHVLPDVVPSVTPTVDLEVLFGTGRGFGDHGGAGGSVLPGVKLSPKLAPTIRATVFHEDERKYTVLMVDPDMPNEEKQKFETYAHWLVYVCRTDFRTDVPLSLEKQTIPDGHPTVLSYIPPHPQKGTPYHRYTTLLFEQPPDARITDVQRAPMDVAKFAQQHGLNLAGIHFWRSEWTEDAKDTVSQIYNDILKMPEPRFGYLPRQDRLKDELGQRSSKYY